MGKIAREPQKAANEKYELIITGGGIYGVMLLLEASRRKIKTLLIEKDDFGGATTLNHLKTVHGGLRYLQSLDLTRFIESVGERKWFMKYFPGYVNPMSCLMPLYGSGLKRNSVMRIALLLNDLLSFNRNVGIRDDRKLPGGKIFSAEKTVESFPDVDQNGLKGGAFWTDAGIGEFQRLVMYLMRKSIDRGAAALNYMKAVELRTEGNKVSGVTCIDSETGKEIRFSCDTVINAAGPWSREVSAAFDRDHPELFKKNLLLWNILFDRKALSENALGVTPQRGRGHTYFFHPWKGRLLVGTGEIVVDDIKDDIRVPEAEIGKFLDDMNSAVPGIGLTRKNILNIYAGILPATVSGTLAKRPAFVDHSAHSGPGGLYSVSGVKFTTSRLVAEKTIRRIFPGKIPAGYDTIFPPGEGRCDLEFGYDEKPDAAGLKKLKDIIDNESVIRLSDLVLRRTSLGENPERASGILDTLKPLFNGDAAWWKKEKQETEACLNAGKRS